MPAKETRQAATVSVENIGGIEATQVALSPGVTVLSGRNATNRTSFLRAVMGALGSRDVSLRAGAEAGRVELQLNGEPYERSLTRTDTGVTMTGDPYLDDPTKADLFAFLLRSNRARRAIIQRQDLRDVILEPIDTESIQAEIARLEDRRLELDRELEELDSLETRLPTLEQEKTELDSKLEETRSKFEEIQSSIESISDADDTTQSDTHLLERLRDLRQERQRLRRRIETERESIAALREDRSQIQESLETMQADEGADPAELDREIESLREQKRDLESTISRLQQIHQFNGRVLDNGEHSFRSSETAPQAKSPTDQLVGDDVIECWTCGNEAERNAFEATQDRLWELIEEHRSKKDTIDQRLSEFVEQRNSLEQSQQEIQGLQDRLEDIETELERRERRVDENDSELTELETEIQSLETEIDDSAASDERIERHKEVSELEYEIERLEGEREEVLEEIRSIEAEMDRRPDLEAEWETVQSDLQSLRSKIERIETDAVEAFNDEIDTVLERLEYDNIARIWLERIEDGGNGNVRFELNIVRETDGVVHQDRLDHLSESEREVTGLVFALAGYLVHEVHETVPFMLLDSLEAIDADRIARIIDYFEEYARYLLVALLPEDAEALDEQYHRIEVI